MHSLRFLPVLTLLLLQLPVSAALVGRYRMDAASGNQPDSSGVADTADAIPQGSGHLYGQEAVPGGIYGSINLPAGAIPASAGFPAGTLNPATDHWVATTTAGVGTITAPNKYNALLNNFTVMGWIKPSVTTKTMRIFSTQVSGVTNHSWGFGFTNLAKLRLTDFGQYDIDSTPAPVVANTWQHIAAVKSSTAGILLYHNGSLIRTDAARTANVTAAPNGSTAWRLLNGPNNEIFIGLVADIRIYNNVLTQTEILLAAGHQPNPTGTLAGDTYLPAVTANPFLNFSHGTKSATNAASLSLFTSTYAASANRPANRFGDAGDNLWAGKAPADQASVLFPGAGGVATDWQNGKFYHAWSGGRTDILTSRYTVPATGYYDLSAAWRSHTQSGAKAQVSVVLNGTTLFNSPIDGFDGTPLSATVPFGPNRSAAFVLPGYNFVAGDTVDVITVPDALTPSGNLALDFSMLPVAGPPVATASLVLSEFVASNDRGLADEDGRRPDWIEIYNGTGVAVDLTGWSLTDNASQPHKWDFPSRTLAHGEFLVVFADNRDAEKRPFYTATSNLHTNFQLSAAGEYLALVNPAGAAADAHAPYYPAQIPDIAFGRAGSTGPGIGYLTPTPGRINGSVASAAPGAVTFSVASGVFAPAAPQSVALSAPPGQSIRYTVNNTEPTLANGATYTGVPLLVTTTTVIRARAFVDGVGGAPAEARYLFVDPAVQPDSAASYTLPVVVIDTLAGGALGDFSGGTEDPQKVSLIAVYEPDGTGRTSLGSVPSVLARGASHVRGQSSSTYKKQGLDLELWDETGGDRSEPLLGMPSDGDWALYAPYEFDRTYVNNRLTYEMAARMGRYAPRTRFVEVYVNTDGGALSAADYYGIYVLSESIERGGSRIDIAGIDPTDNSGDALTGGYIVSINKSNEAETVLASGLTYMRHMRQNKANITLTGGMTTFLDYPEITTVTPAQKNYIDNYLKLTEEAIYGAGFTHPSTGQHYTSYLGRDTWIDFHLAQTVPQNIDALRLSTFFYKERNGKLKAGPVWDYDRSLNSRDGRNAVPGVWDTQTSLDKTEYFHYGWWHRLFQDPDFMQLWIDRYAGLRRAGQAFDLAGVINPLVDAYIAEVAPPGSGASASIRDYARWPFGAAGSGTGLSNARQPLATEVAGLKTWLTDRFNFIDGQMLRTPVASARNPGDGSVTLSLTGGSGTAEIHVTANGSDPRLSGGGLNPAAELVPNGGTITVNSTSLIRFRQRDLSAPAFNSDLTTTKMSPWSAEGQAYYIVGADRAAAGNVTVSALHYHPVDPSPAEQAAGFTDADQFEFIELQNISSNRVNLEGCRFSAGFDFTFPPVPLGELASGEKVIVVKNLAAFSFRHGVAAARVIGEFGGNDNLDNAGETLTLLASDGVTPVFSFVYDDEPLWPAEADGTGPCLILRAPESNPPLGDPLSWRLSQSAGGTPGGTDRTTYGAWKAAQGIPNDTADDDGDGVAPLVEYALGTDPAAPSSGALPSASFQPDGTLSLSFTRSLTADDAAWEVQASGDLGSWTPAAFAVESRTFGPGTETLFLSIPPAAADRRFVRIKFTLR